MIHIDGSYGEGGGQILRSALALSIITGRPFVIDNIRAGRKKPGLRPQHRACVKAAAAISGAEVKGAEIGSLRLQFSPGSPRSGTFRFEVGTAGATGLVLQTVYLPLSLARNASRVRITGGTHVPMAPCYHYLSLVFTPMISLMGLDLKVNLIRWGFYPVGGGEIEAKINPVKELRPLWLLEDFRPSRIEALSVVAESLPKHISKRQALRLQRGLEALGIDHQVRSLRVKSSGPGTMVFVLAESESSRAGFTAIGIKGKPAEVVAEEALGALTIFLETGAPVDEHLADQLILPAALAAGETRYRTSRITRHLLTNLWVIRHFLEIDFEIHGREGTPGEIVIRGGLT